MYTDFILTAIFFLGCFLLKAIHDLTASTNTIVNHIDAEIAMRNPQKDAGLCKVCNVNKADRKFWSEQDGERFVITCCGDCAADCKNNQPEGSESGEIRG